MLYGKLACFDKTSRYPSHTLLAAYSRLFHILNKKPNPTGMRCQSDKKVLVYVQPYPPPPRHSVTPQRRRCGYTQAKKVHDLDLILGHQTALFILSATPFPFFFFIYCVLYQTDYSFEYRSTLFLTLTLLELSITF